MDAHGRYDAVLMVGFGGPTCAQDIRPFLDNVVRGRPIAKERYEEVARHYEYLGGRSPYNELTFRQARALQAELEHCGIAAPVFVGMRNWAPYLCEAITEMAARGVRRAIGFVLAAFRSEASWERYQTSVRDACRQAGASIEVGYPEPWHNHPLFIRAVAARAREAIERLEVNQRARSHLIFTAHSIPVAMAKVSPYVEQLTESASAVAAALDHKSYSLAFQSRSGSHEPWLDPDIKEALRARKDGPAIVVPIGFLCDHVEVLYDLDVETAQIARENGVHLERASTVGDHPLFIQMMASIVRQMS